MTGRELIILILENNFEDKSITELYTLFETMDQTAERLGVGIATVGYLVSIRTDQRYYTW